METSALHYAKGYRHGEEVSTPHLIGPLRRGRSHQSPRHEARESARVSESVIYGDGGAALQSGAPATPKIYTPFKGTQILHCVK